MWRTDTSWFDVALATSLLLIGHLCFGRFEEHKPRWRRVTKVVLGVTLIVGTSVFAGRSWTFVLLGVVLIAVVVVHAWWLPRNGVNGWTAEPRARYYELIGFDTSAGSRDRAD